MGLFSRRGVLSTHRCLHNKTQVSVPVLVRRSLF
uniref:Uncharacterized protein n=1 Tax=Manihot esculenta TaxID=3983 RepID=A0A2C9V5U1_MANES